MKRTLQAEHATIQPLPMKSAKNWKETRRGAGLARGNKTVYGVPTALLRKSIITSRFTEVRSQQEAAQTKRGANACKSCRFRKILQNKNIWNPLFSQKMTIWVSSCLPCVGARARVGRCGCMLGGGGRRPGRILRRAARGTRLELLFRVPPVLYPPGRGF